MRHSRAAAIVCFLCLCLGLAGNAGAQETGFQAVPDVLRPGKMYSVEVNAPYTGGASLYLTDDTEKLLTQYAKLDDYGRHTVASVMQVEYERCSKLNNLDD